MIGSLIGSGEGGTEEEGGALYIYGSLKTRARLNSAVVRSSAGCCIISMSEWDIIVDSTMIDEGSDAKVNLYLYVAQVGKYFPVLATRHKSGHYIGDVRAPPNN